MPQTDIAPGCHSSANWQLRAAVGAVHAITSGHHKLISSKRQIVKTGEVLDTWGANPKGFISYGKYGRMLVLIVTDDRRRYQPTGADRFAAATRI